MTAGPRSAPPWRALGRFRGGSEARPRGTSPVAVRGGVVTDFRACWLTSR
jgi:hypothetical protein